MVEETGVSSDPILQSLMRLEKARADGHAAFEEGDFRGAVRHYTKAIALYPDDSSLYCDRSSAYANLKKFAKAKADAKRAYELRPRCPRSHLVLGISSLGLGRMDQALKYLNEGLVVDPDDEKLKVAVARVGVETNKMNMLSSNRNRTNQGVAAGPLPIKTGFAQSGTQNLFPYLYWQQQPLSELAQLRAGRALVNQNPLQTQPITTEETMMRGNAALNEGNPRAAVRHYTEGISLSPDNVDLYSSRSAAYASLGEFVLAHEDATRAHELSPGSPVVYLRLGLAHLRLGRTDLALKALKHGLEIDPNDRSLRAACARANVEALKTVKMCRDIMEIGLLSDQGKLLVAQALSESKEDQPLCQSSADAEDLHSAEWLREACSRIDKVASELKNQILHLENVHDDAKTAKTKTGNQNLTEQLLMKTLVHHYSERLKTNPEDVEAYNKRATLHAQLGELSEALKDTEKFTELEPESPKIYDLTEAAILYLRKQELIRSYCDKASGSKICHQYIEHVKDDWDGSNEPTGEKSQPKEVEDEEIPDPEMKIDASNLVVEQDGHYKRASSDETKDENVPDSEPKMESDVGMIDEQVLSPETVLSEISGMKEKDQGWQLL
ncbi:hypothetical protein CRG98_014992 [Punica granatum]|uniref:Uncharacterized protein n=1 Tax=Punica granatum TaxID=22663 RepID=A0A2I0K8P6_PUNGR|nr:hypothetical protein CRG98_014992 [Punica granatum]